MEVGDAGLKKRLEARGQRLVGKGPVGCCVFRVGGFDRQFGVSETSSSGPFMTTLETLLG